MSILATYFGSHIRPYRIVGMDKLGKPQLAIPCVLCGSRNIVQLDTIGQPVDSAGHYSQFESPGSDHRGIDVNWIRDNKWRIVWLAATLVAGHSSPGKAQSQSDYLLFPFAETIHRGALRDDSLLADDEFEFGVDLFAAVEHRNFVFLGEALLEREEQEIERLQVGWRIGGSKVWLGRFHNPIGYWNTQFHHGDYLQTSISRPAMLEYEDHHGLLPMHLAGLLVEGVRERGQRGLGYAIAVATGPELTDRLSAFDVLSPGSVSGGLAVALNVSIQPVAYGSDQYGLFTNYTEIPARDRGIEDIRQLIAGGYWNWESAGWRLTGSVFYSRNQFDDPQINLSDEFGHGYIQFERTIGERWTVFGRVEKTFAGRDDIYLELFPTHIREKALAGLRANVVDRHAVKLEISTNRRQDDRYGQIMLQWAAMFALE